MPFSFCNCNCLAVIVRKDSLYSARCTFAWRFNKDPTLTHVTRSGQVMLENRQLGSRNLCMQRRNHRHDNTNSSLPAPTGPMGQSSSRGVGFQNIGSPPCPLRTRSHVHDAGRRALSVPLIRPRPSAPRNRAAAR